MLIYAVGLTVVFIIVMLIDLPKMLQRRAWRDIIVYLALIAIGYAFSLPQVIGRKVMGPAKVLSFIVERTIGPFWPDS